MTSLCTRARPWACSLFFFAAACGQATPDGAVLEQDPDAIDVASASAPVVSGEAPAALPFDPSALVQEMRVRFRDDGQGGFRTKQGNHAVHVKDGVVRFTPTAWPGGGAGPLSGAAVEIETVAISRDEGDLSATAAALPDADGALTIDRAIAQERIINRADGVEQTWSFEQEPAGSGPLEVRVAIRGQQYLGASAGGHHFIDESNGVGLRYSHAVWIDLAGARTEIPVIFDAELGELVMAVTAETLAHSQYPALLDPVVSAEQNAAAPGIAPAAADEQTPAIAFDGTNYFAVWADNRDVTTYDIWGAFINTAGVVLNPTGVPVSVGIIGDQTDPAVAFNGTNYLVVYEDRRRGAGQVDILAQRITPAGVLVGTEISVSLSGLTNNPDIATLNGEWALVWEDNRIPGQSNSVFSFVSPDGDVAAPVNFNDLTEITLDPAVDCSPTFCTAVFVSGPTNQEDIYRQRFDQNGLLDVESLVISGVGMSRSLLPDIAFDGTNFLVAWQDLRTGTHDIWGQRLGPDGLPQVPNGFPISAVPVTQERAVSIAHDGVSAMVVWEDSRNQSPLYDIYGTRVLNDNTVVTRAGTAISRNPLQQQFPQIVAGGGQFFAVWQDGRQGPPNNIRGVRISAAGVPNNNNGTTIATTADRSTGANIAWGGAASGNTYLLVYATNRTNGADDFDVVGFRVSATGLPLSSSHFTLSGVSPGSQVGPELSFNGTEFLVVWQDARLGIDNVDIRGTRVNLSAGVTIRDPNGGIVISSAPANQLTPTLAWNAGANQWLVAWADQRSTPGTTADVYVARVNTNGTVADPAGVPLTTAAGTQTRPDVASDGTNWFVVYVDRLAGGSNQDNILGSIVTPAGVPGPLLTVSNAALRQDTPRVIYHAPNYIVVWTGTSLGLTNQDVRGSRVSSAGVVLNPNGVAMAANPNLNERRPRAVSLGANILVMWSQSEQQNSPWVNLIGRQFTPTLAVATPLFTVSAVPTTSEDQVAIGVQDPLNTVVSYQRYDSAANLRSERVKFRRVQFP